ncbi:MAG TPA: hypothetical protein VNE39_06880 [Planctomycetota bacterium]|nr:hypothetical protein [Planctomycetota bacterium]
MRVGTRLLILKLAFAAAALAVLLLAMHLLLPGLLGRSAPPPPGAGQARAETKSARVTVPRDGGNLPSGPRVALQVAGQVESFVQAFCAELGPTLGLQRPAEKLDIHVLGTHAEAEAFAQGRKLKPDPAHPSAFHDPASGTLVVTLRPYPDLVGLVLHMATHLLMDRAGGPDAQWSTWLAVGMAVCAEQGALQPGPVRPGSGMGRDAFVVLSVASRGAHVPLHMLARGGPALFAGPLGSLAYRESGLLVLYLLRGPAAGRRQAFLRYLHLERQPGPVAPGALEAALGTDLNGLETEWFVFLRAIARSR